MESFVERWTKWRHKRRGRKRLKQAHDPDVRDDIETWCRLAGVSYTYNREYVSTRLGSHTLSEWWPAMGLALVQIDGRVKRVLCDEPSDFTGATADAIENWVRRNPLKERVGG